MLAVTASARVSAAPPKEEDTLSRGLGTPPLLETHSPVGYCWQNSRCCRPLRGPQHSHIGDFVSHPHDQAQRTGPPRPAHDIRSGAAARRARCRARLGARFAESTAREDPPIRCDLEPELRVEPKRRRVALAELDL